MAVRETFELDVRGALSSVGQIDKAFTTATRNFEQGINKAVSGLSAEVRAPGAESAASGLRQVNVEQRRVQQEAARSATALRTQEASMKSLGVTAGIAGAALAAGLGVAIGRSISFEKSISLVGAVSDASAKDLDRLRQAAIAAGAATIFSAKDAADAEAELAKAGLTTADILGGALTGALNLAAAGQLGLADAATITAQAMKIFGLTGRDTNHIADVLAAGANKSTASVASLGEGLGNVGGAARLAGLSLEETVGTLALLDNNAVRGAEGGTALRSALIALFTPSKQQAEEIRKLGINVFDAGGKFIGLGNLAGELQTKLSGLTDAQRNASLGIIFGTFGIQAATALYKEGKVGVDNYTRSVDDNGAAARFAGKQLDNLAGDLEQLKGSIETGLIVSGSQATGVLRFMAQRATETVNSFAALPGPVQAAGVGLAAVAAAGLGALTVFGTIAPKITAATAALRSTGAAGAFAADNLGKVARGAVGLGAFIALGPQLEKLTGDFTSAGAAAGGLSGAIFGLPGIAAGVVIGSLAGAFGLLGDEAEGARNKMRGAAAEIEKLGDTQAFRKFQQNLSFEALSRGVDGMAASLRTLATASPAAGEAVLRGARRAGFSAAIYRELELAVAGGTRAYARHAANAEKSAQANQQVTSSLGALTAASGADTLAANEAAEAHANYAATLLKGLPTVLDVFDQSTKGIEDWTDASSPKKLLENFQKQLEGVQRWGANLNTLASLGMTELVGIFAEKGPQASGAILQALIDGDPAIIGQLNETAGKARGVLSGLAGTIGGPIADQLYGAFFGAGQAAGQGLSFGLTSQEQAVINAASDLADAAERSMGYALEARSPSRVFARLGVSAAEGFAHGMDYGTQRFVDAAGRRMALRSFVPFPTRSGPTSGGATAGPVDNSFHADVQVSGVRDPEQAGLSTVRRLRAAAFFRGR